MSIQTQIQEQIKEALKAKEALKLSVLRGLSAAFVNELVAIGRKPNDQISDEEALKVIKKEANKRKDSIEQYTKGNRPELANKENEELVVLSTYLPEMMSLEDIKKIAETKKEELGITDKSKIGILIGAIMKETKGQADGKDVKDVVDNLF